MEDGLRRGDCYRPAPDSDSQSYPPHWKDIGLPVRGLTLRAPNLSLLSSHTPKPALIFFTLSLTANQCSIQLIKFEIFNSEKVLCHIISSFELTHGTKTMIHKSSRIYSYTFGEKKCYKPFLMVKNPVDGFSIETSKRRTTEEPSRVLKCLRSLISLIRSHLPSG